MFYIEFDACGKPGAGILRGNMQWMGAYQECISINVQRPSMEDNPKYYQGGYCRAVFALNPSIAGRKKRSVQHTPDACTGAMSGGNGVTLAEDLCLPKGCANDRDATLLVQNCKFIHIVQSYKVSHNCLAFNQQ